MPEESKYPLEVETQYLRLKLAESEARCAASEDRRKKLLRRFAYTWFAVALYGLLTIGAVVGGFCCLTANNNATILRMTEEHAKAMKAAVNAQARQVKYGNEGR